jgi:seryl-tRNA synthetase
MKNGRPTHTLTLPLKDGSTVECTTKTPKLKLQRQVRKLVIDSQMAAEECNSLYSTTNEINRRLGNAIAYVERLRANKAGADDIAGAEESVEQIRGELEQVVEKVNALNDKQFAILTDQVLLVVNIPNEKDGTPRSDEDVDFEEADQEELKEAVSFFLNGPQK